MRFHHVGIPTTEPKEGEMYRADSKLFITDIDSHPYRVEWLRFEPGSPMPDLIQTVAHVAFEVDDLQEAIEGKNVLVQPKTLPNGVRIAFIAESGAPVEFMQLGDLE
ncbi:VOC family protein [Candidatus Bipolaricaulota bacterium]